MTSPIAPSARAAALALLGLPETATGPQIVEAYRRLVRATHPDATGRTDPAAARRFTAIHDAYRLLAQPADDPVERSSGRDPADESDTPRQQPPLPPMGLRAARERPPIVAGPVVVTPLREQHRSQPRRPR